MKLSKKEITVSSVLLVVLVAYFTWDRLNQPRSDERYNHERVRLGIPIIEKSFLPASVPNMWYNPDSVLPRHALKEITIEMGRPIVERDDFEFSYDGRKAKLLCYYHYREGCFRLYFDDGFGNSPKKVSCARANSILVAEELHFSLENCLECR